MTTDQTFDPSKSGENPQGEAPDAQGLVLTLGGQNRGGGKGGSVDVAMSGAVTTSGRDAHAILAQSIGAGGGMVVGGQVNLPPGGTGGNGGASGDGGTVTLNLQPGAAIGTSGDGAFGILAQSIGGGGAAAGHLSSVVSYQLGTTNAIKSNAGNGGTVSIKADNATIQTTGRYAPAIFAQSIGGGGGLVNYSLSDGSATRSGRACRPAPGLQQVPDNRPARHRFRAGVDD